jgi:beta-N-acetylhexosaminidase
MLTASDDTTRGVVLPAAAPPPPPIVRHYIPYPARRKREMRAYARRHYGIDDYRLRDPKVIVEHVSVAGSTSAVFATFAPDVADVELHELPQVCSHFVVGSDGSIVQMVPLSLMCRHTVGLNYVAIGIEHVGTSDAQVLNDRAQMRSSLALTAWLMAKYGIALKNVIGHNESLSSPFHKELYAPWKHQTHGDWVRADMQVYRARLSALVKK